MRPTLLELRGAHLIGVFGIVGALAVSALSLPALVMVAAVLTAMGVALVVGPMCAVAAVAAMLPLVFVTAEIGSTRWSLLELALICCAVACGGELALRVVRRRPVRLMALLRPFDLTVVAVALVVVGILSLEWVADVRAIENSRRELRRILVEPLVVVLAVRLSPIDEVRRLVARALAVSGLLVSALALVQVGLRSSGVEVGAVFRPIGTYPHPNNLALYLERVVWVPLALTSVRMPERLALGVSCLIAVACAATLSRGAVAALAVGGLTWLVLTRRRLPRRILVAALAAASVLVLIARSGGDGTDSLDSRGKIWSATGDMLRDYPLAGIGIDQFFQLYGTRYVDPGGWSERYTSHPHNVVLDFWLQLGVAGLAILAGLIFVAGRRASAIRTEPRDLVGAALLAGLAGGLAHGMIDNGFFLPDLATYLWLALALTAPGSWRAAAP